MHIAPASILLEMSCDYAGYRQHREKGWFGYLDGAAWHAIPFASSHLFRGQTSRHVPMLPSIARGLDTTDLAQLWQGSIRDQAKVVVRLAQSWWFSRELARHPISAHAKSQGLDLDEIGLAQHYGIATGYLDLTDDFNVAGFFASCRWTPAGRLGADGVWRWCRLQGRSESDDRYGSVCEVQAAGPAAAAATHGSMRMGD